MKAKIFNYDEKSKGWQEFPSYEAAKAAVMEIFDTIYWMDKDNCSTDYVEIYYDGKYEVWCQESGSWLWRDSEDEPSQSIYFGTREEFASSFENSYRKFTELNPDKDYILVGKVP